MKIFEGGKRILRYIRLLSMVVAAFLLCLGVSADTKDTANMKAKFLERNPCNNWTFGFLNDTSSFVPFNTTFKISENIVGWCYGDAPSICGDITINFGDVPVDKFGIHWEPGQLCVNPGQTFKKSVIRWTASENANVKVTGKAKCILKNGGKTRVEVRNNGVLLSGDEIAGSDYKGVDPKASETLPSEVQVLRSASIAKGNNIDFIFIQNEEIGTPLSIDLKIEVVDSSSNVSYSPNPYQVFAKSEVSK